jgi:single-strand DNA-binding protein
MPSFNQVILIGNLTRDPQLRYLPSQTAVVDFGLACNRKWKGSNGEDREEVLFVDCSAFARQAEVINEYCRKGRPLFIEGRLKLDQWEDKQGGGKRSKLTVVVENFQLLGSRDAGPPAAGSDETSQSPPAQRPPSQPSPQRPAQQPPFSQEENFKPDDIPF